MPCGWSTEKPKILMEYNSIVGRLKRVQEKEFGEDNWPRYSDPFPAAVVDSMTLNKSPTVIKCCRAISGSLDAAIL